MEQFAILKKLKGKDIKRLRQKLKLTQVMFAQLANVSVKTIERWETSDNVITGPIVTLVQILNQYRELAEEYVIPSKEYDLRMWYMCKDVPCTMIDIDSCNRKIQIER